MTILVKLSDPAIIAANVAGKALYAERVKSALQQEKADIPDNEIDALAIFAWRFKAGDDPALSDTMRRWGRDIHNENIANAKRIKSAYDSFATAINKSGLAYDISDELAKRGISPDEANRVLAAIDEVVGEMARLQPIRTKQGNTKKSRAVWVESAWKALHRYGVGMQQAARILAFVLDGEIKGAGAIYQTIRDSSIR